MFLLVLFFSGCYATVVSDVTCNGRDAMNFVFTKNAGTAITKFTLTGCSGQNVDLTSSAYTVAGDQYTFDFNPYDQCVTSPTRDPNDASTYNVGITLLAIRGENIAGKDVIKGGDKVALSCRFQTNYQVESDLRTISLKGEDLTGEEFRLSFEMDRTQSDYATPDTSEIETNQLVYHTIKSTNSAQLESTDFTFKPYRIRLQKKNDPDSFFDLFNIAMSTCGHAALNFQIAYTNSQYNFKYSQILLDADLAAEYKLVADLKLCNSDASSPECTAFDKCVVSDDVAVPETFYAGGPLYPKDQSLINSDQPVAFWRNWQMRMDISLNSVATYITHGGFANIVYIVAGPSSDSIREIQVVIRFLETSSELLIVWQCDSQRLSQFATLSGFWVQNERKTVVLEGRTDSTGTQDLTLRVDGLEIELSSLIAETGIGATCPEDGDGVAQVYIGDPNRNGADVTLTNFMFRKLE